MRRSPVKEILHLCLVFRPTYFSFMKNMDKKYLYLNRYKYDANVVQELIKLQKCLAGSDTFITNLCAFRAALYIQVFFTYPDTQPAHFNTFFYDL